MNLKKMPNLYYLNQNSLEYKRVRILPVFLFMIMIMFVSYRYEPTNEEILNAQEFPIKSNYNPEVKTATVIDTSEVFSEEQLINYMKDLNIAFPHIVLAQSKLETGHFKSKIFNENNNLFGMKEARVRCHTAVCTQNGHACYDDWKQSVIDYALYQSRYMSDCKNERQYYKKLDKSYAEAKNYSDALKTIIQREKLDELFLDS